jgi:hypothetical protein
MAYNVSYHERLWELLDKPLSQFDPSGLHAATLIVSEIYLCQALCPGLRDLDFHHLHLIRAARRDAERDFIRAKTREEADGT